VRQLLAPNLKQREPALPARRKDKPRASVRLIATKSTADRVVGAGNIMHAPLRPRGNIMQAGFGAAYTCNGVRAARELRYATSNDGVLTVAVGWFPRELQRLLLECRPQTLR
jgi:hypothetical protein